MVLFKELQEVVIRRMRADTITDAVMLSSLRISCA